MKQKTGALISILKAIYQIKNLLSLLTNIADSEYFKLSQ